MQPVNFDDLDDTSLVQSGRTYRELRHDQPTAQPAAEISLGACKSVATMARFPCGKCKGSGKFYSYTGRLVGNCLRCKGTGKQKTDPAAAERRQIAELEARAAKMAAWIEGHKAQAKWITANWQRFDFAQSMRDALARSGSLTDGQLGAVTRLMERDTERAKERAERKPDADVGGAGFDRMVKAFAVAKASELKYPKFRVGEYVFSLANETSQNVGCLYVKRDDGMYVGKITPAGGFFASRDASDFDKSEVARIGADPLGAAVMHGKQTGHCSCCGRELENAESVALGIGPICREKWGL